MYYAVNGYMNITCKPSTTISMLYSYGVVPVNMDIPPDYCGVISPSNFSQNVVDCQNTLST